MIVAGALVTMGCAGPSDDSSEPSAPASTSSSSDPATTAPPSPRGAVKLTGVVAEGVERGCLILMTTEGQRRAWTLVGSTAGVTPGDRVTVRGRPDPSLATRCQEGTPFVVEAVEPG